MKYCGMAGHNLKAGVTLKQEELQIIVKKYIRRQTPALLDRISTLKSDIAEQKRIWEDHLSWCKTCTDGIDDKRLGE